MANEHPAKWLPIWAGSTDYDPGGQQAVGVSQTGINGETLYWSGKSWQQFSLTQVCAMTGAAGSGTLGAIGDSVTAHWQYTNSAEVATFPKGYLAWALALAGQPFTVSVASNAAISAAYVSSGGSVATFTQQADTVVASGAKDCVLMGGVNDIINGVSSATIKAAFMESLEILLAGGVRVWWCTAPTMSSTYGSYTVARQGQFLELNDWIRQICATELQRRGVVCVDTAAKAVDPSSATASYIANGSYDSGLHPNGGTAYLMGKELARVWSIMVPSSFSLLSSTADNVAYSALSNNILTNGLFTAGSPTGTGWTQSVTAGGLNTPSIVANAGGYGNSQRQTLTFAAASDSVRLTSGDLKAYVSVGDWLQASCEVVVASITNLRCIRLSLVMAGSLTSFNAQEFQTGVTEDGILPEGFTATLRTRPVQVTSALGSLTSLTTQLSAFGGGIGGATVDIGRYAVRRLTALA